MGLTSHISCVYGAFSSYCVFFFGEESDDDDSGSGSYITCSDSLFSKNSVGRVSGSKSIGRVSGLFSVSCVSEIFFLNGVTKSVGCVSGQFFVCRVSEIFSLSRVSGICSLSTNGSRQIGRAS